MSTLFFYCIISYMSNEKKILDDFVQEKGLKNTAQRYIILEVFLKQKKHISSDDLYELVRAKYPKIGRATVFRTIKIIAAAGLANQIRNQDGVVLYENNFHKEHHDHMICSNCGKIIEFENKEIEKLQEKIAKQYNFKLQEHIFKLLGLCKECQKK